MPIICGKCGNQMPDERRFCTNCGQALISNPAPNAPAAPTAPLDAADMTTGAPTAVSPGPMPPPMEHSDSWEREQSVRAPDAPDTPPRFDIKTIHSRRTNEPAFAAPKPAKPGVFDRHPYLIHLICFSFLTALVFTLVIRINDYKRKNQKKAPAPATATAKPGQKNTPAPPPECKIKLLKALGIIYYHPHAGSNSFTAAAGGCLPSGSIIFTEQNNGRAAFDVPRLKLSVFVNKSSTFTINSDRGKDDADAAISLLNGEVWVELPGAKSIALDGAGKHATIKGPGKFHLLVSANRIYFTCMGGEIDYRGKDGTVIIQTGQQLATAVGTDEYAGKAIRAADFQAWVDSWKNNFAPPKQAAVEAVISEADAKNNEQKLILKAMLESFQNPLPNYVSLQVTANTEKWAIVRSMDKRPDPEQLTDFWPQKAYMLQKVDGKWTYQETFTDYNEYLFSSWKTSYGFDKQAEKDLGLGN